MKNKFTNWIPALLLAAVLIPLVQTASAQVERHIVTIANGKVLIDGAEIPKSELPASLQTQNVRASMNFTGDALLELNGTVYQLLDGRLVEAADDVARDGRVVVFFRDPEDSESVVRVLSRRSDDDSVFGQYQYQAEPNASGVVMEKYYDALENKAKEFEVIRGQLVDQNGDQAVQIADRLRIEAENAARIAKAFPRIEFESYLEGIHETDRTLYNQLIEEHSIETETHRLAMEARATTDANRRARLVEELRRKLESAFDLKQQNREREIEQLSEKLTELRQRIAERSEAKNRIIEARLKELLGELDW